MASIGVLSGHFADLEADLVVTSLEALPADAFARLVTLPSRLRALFDQE
jgi:hypothetical protein